MRAAVVVLVAFAVLYVLVTFVGVRKHGNEPPATATTVPPRLPALLSDAWPIAPAFLKVRAGDVSLHREQFYIPPGTGLPLVVGAATGWYQPKRLMRLTYDNAASGGSVALTYPAIAQPPPAGSPDPLTAGAARQVIVLPKTGGVVMLSCNAVLPCSISL